MSVQEHYRKQPNKPLKLGFVLTILFLGLILSATAYMFINLTQGDSSTAESQDDSGSGGEQSTRASRSEKKLAALEFKRKMLAKDKALKDKYESKRRARKRYDKPDKDKAYRAWRDEKERNERYLSRMKDVRTNDPASVKVQMMKSSQRLAEDKPQR